ncbi:unnamed protein product [Plutella xylostella]|uniref:Protein CNPPD1 n=1 Tax=Plutella xylostella TaxID=51655 RepID=A0A8S4DFU9_PLUXY|nr:unnamed protein product [Plutella xylostella]
MSNVSKRRKEGTKARIKSMGDHQEFLKRISKTLYYGQLPTLPCLSLPVTEISCSLWSDSQRGRSLRRLHLDAAAGIARSACVSPCALVLAILYLERLHACSPDYLAATHPADLFLVSLMVGNKFLQDDGEDDEVICSEWAVSGGMDLKQLKKLEIDFLNAIDWKVYVSEDEFQERLRWLERQVALKQAQLRGFFTYTDLAATCEPALLAELVRAVSSTCLALTLSYVSSLMAFVTSTLVISQAWLPTLQYVAATRSASLTTVDSSVISSNMNAELPVFHNATTDTSDEDVLEEPALSDALRCCTRWLRYQETTAPRKWYETVVISDLKLYESWWSETSVLNWLYQSSLINPMQRWLEKINEYGALISNELGSYGLLNSVEKAKGIDQCYEYGHSGGSRRCVSTWLNLSRLSALMATAADR